MREIIVSRVRRFLFFMTPLSVAYELGRATQLLGAEFKYDPNQPRDDIGRWADSASWPDGFPKIEAMTSGSTLKNHPDYEAAKAGDSESAARVVVDVAKIDKIQSLGKLYPNAKIVPVHAEEAKGRNKLPVKYAGHIGGITGQEVELGIVQSNRVHHTGADAAWRFAHRAEFDGEVKKGQEYILADDFVTAGGTVSELRQYIESKGGKVVAVTSLANAHSAQTGNSGNLALNPETKEALDKKFGYNNVHEFLKEHGVYGGNPAALTNSEARWLLTFGSLDAVRDRIAASRSGSGSQRSEGKRNTPPGNRKSWSGLEGALSDAPDTAAPDSTAGDLSASDLSASDLSDTLISFGSEIKSVAEDTDGWRFGGWLVVFDSPDVSPQRDTFTKSTDFDIEDGERRSVYFHHGLDGTIKRARLGDCRVFIKDAGVWIEGQIKKRNDYLKAHVERIAGNIEKFGLSSGAPAHLVERKAVAGGHEMLLWPLAEASITPCPAEPLTGCVSLKSLVELEEGAEIKYDPRQTRQRPRPRLNQTAEPAALVSPASVSLSAWCG